MQVEQSPGRPMRRALAGRLVVLAAAVAAGLALQHVLAERLASIDALSKRDMLAARAELAQLFQIASVSVFGLTGALGVTIVLASRKAVALQQFPPPGRLSWGGARAIVSGPRAVTLARVGMGLGATLVVASAAGGGLMWYMALVLRACRAGVSRGV
jgi:hypothetical protein